MTVAQNIGRLEMLGKPKADIAATVERMLALVKMTDLAGDGLTEASGGQQQRVALARALAQPKVLLLDEPLSALDLKLRKEMQVELKRIQLETGITFIFVTHDQEEALTMSDRIAVMSSAARSCRSARHGKSTRIRRTVSSPISSARRISSAPGFRAQRAIAGGEVEVLPSAAPAQGEVTLAIRPEHLRLVAKGTAGALTATVGDAVYFDRQPCPSDAWRRHRHRRAPADGPGIAAARGRRWVRSLASAPPAAVQVLED